MPVTVAVGGSYDLAAHGARVSAQPMALPHHLPGWTVCVPEAVNDTRVEVLDARSGRLFAETRLREAVAFALGGGLFGAVRVREDETIVLDVLRLGLMQPRR